jgi:putative peptidoglycan lipid II flippase
MSGNVRVARATLVVMLATIAVKLSGMAKQIYIAARFGTTSSMDGFVIAFLLPMLIAGLVAGSFNASLIPLYIEKREKEGQTEADTFFFSLLARSGLVLLLFSVLMSAAAPLLIPVMGWGFSKQTLGVAVPLARMLSFFILFEGLMALLAGMLNARGRFAFPALTPMIVSLVVIASLYFLQSWGIRSLAAGYVCGSLLGVVGLCMAAWGMGFGWKLSSVLAPIDWRRFGAMALPLFCGSAFASLSIVVDKLMASTLVSGSVSALNYANAVVSAPMDLFIYALTTAILPFFAYQAVRGELTGFKRSFGRTVKAASIILLPVTAGVIALGLPLIKLVFERGVFDERASLMTWQAAAFFSLGLFPFAVGMVLVRYFTAIQDTLTILKVAVANLGVNILGNYILMQFMGHAGIALATSITYCFSTMWLLMVAKRRMGKPLERGIIVKLPRICIFAAGAGALAFAAFRSGVAGGFVGNLILGVAVLAVSYFLALLAFEREELRQLLNAGW